VWKANAEDTTQHVILLGRGSGYSLVVDGQQRGEQESSMEAGMQALAKACKGKPGTWREVRGTVTDGATGVLRVTELGKSVMDDFELVV
jgi:hypothetical protein